jgi:hypothetical protein
VGKQHQSGRSSDRDETPEQAPAQAPEVDPLLAEQDARGNQALQAQLGGDQVAEPQQVGMDVVRDVAVPLVERAVLALELGPLEPGRHERFVEIVEGSRMPEDRRQILVDKLTTDQAAASAIEEAVGRWFGQDGPALRSDVSRVLDAVWTGLVQGRAVADGWRVGEQEVPLSEDAQQGAIAGRAEAMVADVADAVAPSGPAREGARGGLGAAVRGLCRDVVLAFAFDEDEEEEEAIGWEMGIEEG